MKVREIISNDLDLNECYSRHDPERHLRDFNCWSDTLGNANASSAVTCKSYNSKNI